MALPFPTDPATPSLPNPYFQDNGFVRGDQQRSNNSQIWADLAYLAGLANGPDYQGLFISNNASNPDSAIDISAGTCRTYNSGLYTDIALPAFTKTVSAFAAGTGNGGLDTGSIAANTWYYQYAIYDPANSKPDVLISASASSPVMPTGYTRKRLLRAVFLTDGTGKICMFNQDAGYAINWTNSAVAGTTNAYILDCSTNNPGTSGVLQTLRVPPIAGTQARIIGGGKVTAAFGSVILFSPTASKDVAPSDDLNAAPLGQIAVLDSNARAADARQMDISVDGFSQIRYRCSQSSSNLTVYITTLGFLLPPTQAV